MGLGPDHGISLFGPCTDEKVELEEARLTQIVASITARGYLPDRFGDITGYFLVRQDEFRFVVRGGKHRSAALAALGWTHLPVRLKPGWVPAVSLETLGRMAAGAQWRDSCASGAAGVRALLSSGTEPSSIGASRHEPVHLRCSRHALHVFDELVIRRSLLDIARARFRPTGASHVMLDGRPIPASGGPGPSGSRRSRRSFSTASTESSPA
jgi:hypothetical protein